SHPETETAQNVVAPQASSADTRRHLVAALLSALAPGAGQLLIGQRRKGIFLLLVFVALWVCVFPLRLPRFFAGLLLIALVSLGLSLYASCAALLQRRTPSEKRVSKLWILSIPVLGYFGSNVVFTPLFLVSGFRALKVASSAMETTLLVGDQFVL